MVVRTKQELDERISQGWGLTIKRGRFYVQRRMPGGRVVSEIVAKNLNDYAAQLYQEIRGKKPDNVEEANIEDKEQEDKKTDEKAEKMEKEIDKELRKKAKQSVVKHLAKTLDKRTQYLIEWGLWVEANILPRADGETWEEKAKNTLDLLNKIKDSVGRMLVLADENEKLRKENTTLKDMIKVMIKKLDAVNLLRDALNKAIMNGASIEVIDRLISAIATFQLNLAKDRARWGAWSS